MCPSLPIIKEPPVKVELAAENGVIHTNETSEHAYKRLGMIGSEGEAGEGRHNGTHGWLNEKIVQRSDGRFGHSGVAVQGF
jgi:hypothetical protein